MSICFLGCALSAQALIYSHTEETSFLSKSRFLAQTLLQKNEITYCVAAPENAPSALPADQAALREWTHGLAVRIRAAGREKEMADILKILDKPLTLTRLPACDLTETINAQLCSFLTLTRLPACDLTGHPVLKEVHPSFNPEGQKADLTLILSSPYCSQITGAEKFFFAFEYKGNLPFMCVLQDYANPLKAPAPQDYFPAAKDPQKSQLISQANRIFTQAAAGSYQQETQTKL